MICSCVHFVCKLSSKEKNSRVCVLDFSSFSSFLFHEDLPLFTSVRICCKTHIFADFNCCYASNYL